MSYVPPRDLPPLVAHRGNAAEFPENTLEALASAIELGVHRLEFDIQLTADLRPVLMHDDDLQRVASRPDCVHDLTWAELGQVPILEEARFGDRFATVRAPSLVHVAETLTSWPAATAFVEVKSESLRRFGRETTLERIAAATEVARHQCVFISFDLPSVRLLRAMTGARVGWVLERFDDESERLVREVAPDFVFGDVNDIPAQANRLWEGPWQWAIYEVRDAATARRCAGLGADFVETMTVRDLLADYARARDGG